MAIGDVTASGGLENQLSSDRSGQIKGSALAGLGEGVAGLVEAGMGLLNSATKIDQIYHDRSMKSSGTEFDTRFVQLQEKRAQEFTELSRQRSANPVGMTKEYEARLAAEDEAFLADVPPLLRNEYKAKLERDRAIRTGSMFRAELELMDSADAANLGVGLDTLSGNIRGKTVDLETAELEWEDMVTKSGLPEATKAELIRNGKAQLQGAEFSDLVEGAAKGYGVTTDKWTGNDVVAAGIDPGGRGVLNVISAGEANAYDIWNGGAVFQGYDDHPAAFGKPPGASSAAGRYQFTYGTWNAAKDSYYKTYGVKVPNFSPEWQDRVALHWAEVQFNRRNKKGLNFRQVLASGDPAQLIEIKKALGNPINPSDKNSVEWQGIGDGYMSDEKFMSVLTGQQGLAGGGTGPASMPDIWNDPRYANIGYSEKVKMGNAASEAADQWKRNEAQGMKDAVAAFNKQMYDLAYNGADLSDMEKYKSDSLWSVDAEKQFREGVDARRKKESSVAEVERKLTAGQPLGATDQQALTDLIGPNNLRGIETGDQASYDRLRGIVTSAKMMPQAAVDSFNIALANPQTATQALEFLAQISKGSPDVLSRSGFSDDVLADATLFATIAANTSPEQAAQQYATIKENAKVFGDSPGKARDDAIKLFRETYPTSTAIAEKMRNWFEATPDMTLNENVSREIYRDMAEAYVVGYRLYGGDVAGAEAYAQASIERNYGVSYTRGGAWELGQLKPVLMKHPPEKYYGEADGEYEYIYSAMDAFVETALPGANIRGGTAVLIPDAQTEKEVKAGEPPTYMMTVQGEFGEIIAVPGRFGGAGLAATGEAEKQAAYERDAQLPDLNRGVEVLEQQRWELDELRRGNLDGVNDETIAAKEAEIAATEESLATQADAIDISLTNALPLWLTSRYVAEPGTEVSAPREPAEMVQDILVSWGDDPKAQRRVESLTNKLWDEAARYGNVPDGLTGEVYQHFSDLAAAQIIAKESGQRVEDILPLVKAYYSGELETVEELTSKYDLSKASENEQAAFNSITQLSKDIERLAELNYNGKLDSKIAEKKAQLQENGQLAKAAIQRVGDLDPTRTALATEEALFDLDKLLSVETPKRENETPTEYATRLVKRTRNNGEFRKELRTVADRIIKQLNGGSTVGASLALRRQATNEALALYLANKTGTTPEEWRPVLAQVNWSTYK